MSAPLTHRQQEIYNFLAYYQDKHGYVPTRREIGAALGIRSPNGVVCHLKALQRKGVIEAKPNKCRAITLKYAGDSRIQVLLERIEALELENMRLRLAGTQI